MYLLALKFPLQKSKKSRAIKHHRISPLIHEIAFHCTS
jgi:hypothetical protein